MHAPGEPGAESSAARRQAERNIAAIAGGWRAMLLALKRQAVRERFQSTTAEARTARLRAAELRAAAAAARRQAERTRAATADTRRMIILTRTPLFVVAGFVESEKVEARWVPGVGLICPPPLLERAHVIVGMGDTFAATPDGVTVAAALDTPNAALLTITRAMSRVESVEMSPALPGNRMPFVIRIT